MLSLSIAFTNCTNGDNLNPLTGEEYNPNNFGFETSELVVEVAPDIKSFRINGEFDNFAPDNPYVNLDKVNTTAKHKVHFINTPVGSDGIGEFTFLEGKKMYKDVVILPENITEEVRILYYIYPFEGYPESFIYKLTVILRPKK